MNMTNGLLTFSEGSLASPFSANVLATSNTTISATQPLTNRTTVGLSKKIGIFKGGFRHPENTNVVTKFSGAILQQQNYGAGFFAGTNYTGSVVLNPQ